LSLLQFKAWMAEHVFLTMALVIALTVLVMVASSHALQAFYLRLFQIAIVSQFGIGLAALVMAGTSGDHALIPLGAAVLGITATTYYAGMEMRGEAGRQFNAAKKELALKDAELAKLRDGSAIRLVVEPATTKPPGNAG
jgi:hypothetical protein